MMMSDINAARGALLDEWYEVFKADVLAVGEDGGNFGTCCQSITIPGRVRVKLEFSAYHLHQDDFDDADVKPGIEWSLGAPP